MGGDEARVAYPLFQEENGGSIPTSPLQFLIGKLSVEKAIELNELWHSRLPRLENYKMCEAFGAEHNGVLFAIAFWSDPVARALNGRNWFELRRMAICNEAPKNTASRFLAVITRMIKRDRPYLVKLISYQDTDVHTGTIYKASGWKIGNVGERIDETSSYNNWKTRPGRTNQSTAPKIRWEKDLQ